MSHFTITVGRLLWGSLRDFLNEEKFKGRQITWIESSGIIERDFIVKGSHEDIKYICRRLEIWQANMEKDDQPEPSKESITWWKKVSNLFSKWF